MRKLLLYSFTFSILLSLSSCFEFIESYHFKSDQSGTGNYIINLSQSKLLISALLAKDSINGKPVPSKIQINQEFKKAAQEMNNFEGISNFIITPDWDDYIFKCSFNFKNTSALMKVQSQFKGANADQFNGLVFNFNGHSFEKKLPELNAGDQSEASQEMKKLGFDEKDLNKAKLTFIYRFDKEIASFDNKSYKLSGNKKAIMFSTSNLNENSKVNTNVKVLLKK